MNEAYKIVVEGYRKGGKNFKNIAPITLTPLINQC